MIDVVSFLRNYDYEICLAKGKKWSLEEAVDYLAAYQANEQIWSCREEAYKGFVSIRERISTLVQHGIDDGRLVIEEVFQESRHGGTDDSLGEIDFRKSIVAPLMFITWAIDSQLELPKQYLKYAAANKNSKKAYYESLGVKKSSIHHERTRAVAELLWSIEPEITIAQMARRSEIIQFGCEGEAYDMRTISRWLASLKTDRKLGRPRKSGPSVKESESSEVIPDALT